MKVLWSLSNSLDQVHQNFLKPCGPSFGPHRLVKGISTNLRYYTNPKKLLIHTSLTCIMLSSTKHYQSGKGSGSSADTVPGVIGLQATFIFLQDCYGGFLGPYDGLSVLTYIQISRILISNSLNLVQSGALKVSPSDHLSRFYCTWTLLEAFHPRSQLSKTDARTLGLNYFYYLSSIKRITHSIT